MQRLFTFSAILILAITFIQYSSASKSHRHHKAHVHGEVDIDIVFDGTKGRIEFEAPAESVLGFEHPAKSSKDKKKLEDSINDFQNNFSKWVQFDSSKKCLFTPVRVEQKMDDDAHSDFEAQFDIQCESSIEGTKVLIDLSKFKRVKEIETTVVVGSIQKSFKNRGQKFDIEIK